MSTLLHINSSLFSNQGVSSQMAEQFVRNWQEQHPTGGLIQRDLVTHPLPALDGYLLQALMSPEEQRDAAQQALVAQADALIAEVQQADVLVLGAPMYNFGVPSQLKTWFDLIARAGVTFRYTEQGAEGLLQGKKVYVFTSRGGEHQGKASDGVTPWLQTMLGFLGMQDVTFVYAEGLNLGESSRSHAIATASRQIDTLQVA